MGYARSTGPPIAVFAIAGCGADLLINICLTLLGYIPGHVHAFYLEYVYYDRRERLRQGSIVTDRAPGVYSNKVQNGGNPHGYGTIVQPNASKPHGPADSENSLLHDEDDARPVIPEQPARQTSLPLRVQPRQGPQQPRTPSFSFPASSPSLPPLSRPAAPLSPRLSRTPPSSDTGTVVGGRSRKKRQRPGQTAVSVIASTAEGKSFPLDDTSARQKLASTCPTASPSNHRYAKSTGAESRTYSKPVLVRTRSSIVPQYRRGTSNSSRVPPSQSPDLEAGPRSGQTDLGTETSNQNEGSHSHSNQDANGRKTRNMMSTSDQPENGLSSLPLLWERRSTSSRPIVVRSRNGKPKKLPPMDAFSFKSFMAEMDAQGGNNIGADLDRIAEICARSRYSLSNQYEVHMAPHGSGASLVSPTGGPPAPSSGAVSRRRDSGSYTSGQSTRAGPTLQAILPDEEESGARRRRRGLGTGGRRTKSIAYGTLETIMSSSRSSEEDKSSKKSAAEIAGEVRGRIEKRHSNLGFFAPDTGSRTATTSNHHNEHTASGHGLDVDGSHQKSGEVATASVAAKLARKRSASFATAVMDSHSRSSAGQLQRYESTCALVSEPALPQTSDSHLGVRTAAAPSAVSGNSIVTRPSNLTRSVSDVPYRTSRRKEYGAASSSALARASWNAWIPWKGGNGAGSQQQQQQQQHEQVVRSEAEELTPTMSAGMTEPRRTVSHAEGSLRRILGSR
ncbi:LOW QUALITY PROTEIN: hypothetical protein QBC45DRAFT_452837 [Copromyces sp. CBS 386.78]|nr:LOW QUALITY PROTEIN: hypothetical protein QBC45DRAFT_452837 [Copromyces sp. CBS 386.78]